MKSIFARRCRRRSCAAKGDGTFFKKDGPDTFFPGSGQSLSPDINRFFSSRMGYDFSNVRLHTGKEAAESANAINAKAYTIDNNIVFGEGQYNAGSGEGKKLIAHELAHVAQQGKSKPGSTVINRKTTFGGKPKDDINIAEKYTEAVKKGTTSSHVGITVFYLNGKNLSGSLDKSPLNIPSEKDIKTEKKDDKYESSVSNIPDNAVTYEKHIPLKPDGNVWTYNTEADNFSKIINKKCSGKPINIYVTGKPDSATVINSVDAHEEAHVRQMETVYNNTVVAFDTALKKMTATDVSEKESKAKLAKTTKGAAGGIYAALVSQYETAANDFHGTKPGRNASFSAVNIDPSCMWIKSNVSI